jgi:hypothetical protein
MAKSVRDATGNICDQEDQEVEPDIKMLRRRKRQRKVEYRAKRYDRNGNGRTRFRENVEG